MNCIDVRENLSLYIDDEMNSNEKRELEEHLTSCAECMREYDELSEVTMLLRAVPDAHVPDSFDERLKLSIKQEKVKKISEHKKRWGRFSGIAAVFVIGIFTFTMYNHMDRIGESNIAPMADSEFNEDMASEFGTVMAESEISEINESMADNEFDVGMAAGEFDKNKIDDVMPEASMMREAQLFDNQYPGALEKALSDEAADYDLESLGEDAGPYLELLREELKGLNYTVINYFQDMNGVWNFEVKISTVSEFDGFVTEVDIYSGQDGELWKKDL